MKILQSLRDKIKNPSLIGFTCAALLYLGGFAWFLHTPSNHVTSVRVDGNSTVTMRLASINSGGDTLRHSTAAPKPKKQKHKKPKPKPKKPSIPEQTEPTPEKPIAQTEKVDEKAQASNANQEGSNAESLAYNQGVSDEFLSKIRIAISNNNVYPRIARIRGLEGEIMVEFILNADGSMEGLKILHSNAGDILNKSALRAVDDAHKEFPLPKHRVRIKVPIVYSLARN